MRFLFVLSGLPYVINMMLPDYPETYIHRIGRCGRFGRKGTAISIISKSEYELVDQIEKYYSTKLEEFHC